MKPAFSIPPFSTTPPVLESSVSSGGNDPVPGGWATQIVLPSLIHLRAAAFGLPLDPVHVRSERGGSYLSAFKGRGVEFAESRPYQAGDEVRYMDWRITARTGKPHTKVFHEDRERSILVWVDLRRAMFFATQGTFKAVLAARAAALVAWGAALHGDRLGGLLFSEERHLELRPFHGDRAVSRLLGMMAEFTPDNRVDPTEEETSEAAPVMEASLLRLRRVTRSGSQLYLFSDFVQLGEREKMHLVQLSRHNTVVMMFFHDRLERALPPPGWYPVMEGLHAPVLPGAKRLGAVRRFLDSHAADKRREYRKQFQKRHDDLHAFCRQHGIHFLPCSTVEDSVALLQRFFGVRSRTGKSAP